MAATQKYGATLNTLTHLNPLAEEKSTSVTRPLSDFLSLTRMTFCDFPYVPGAHSPVFLQSKHAAFFNLCGRSCTHHFCMTKRTPVVPQICSAAI